MAMQQSTLFLTAVASYEIQMIEAGFTCLSITASTQVLLEVFPNQCKTVYSGNHSSHVSLLVGETEKLFPL